MEHDPRVLGVLLAALTAVLVGGIGDGHERVMRGILIHRSSFTGCRCCSRTRR